MTTTTALTILCPTWCARTDHYADDLSDGSAPHHYAPDFGEISIQAQGDGPFSVEVMEAELAGADGLRRLAVQALAAAEWLEARS